MLKKISSLYFYYFRLLLLPSDSSKNLSIDKFFEERSDSISQNSFFKITNFILLVWPFVIIGNLIHLLSYGLLYDKLKVLTDISSDDSSLLQGLLYRSIFSDMNFWSFFGHNAYPSLLVLSCIFFPIFTLISVFVWKTFIKLGLSFSDKENVDEKIDEILCLAITSKTTLILPLAGDALASILWPFYIYVGLNKNLKLSSFHSFLVLILPFLVMSLSVITFLFCMFLILGL